MAGEGGVSARTVRRRLSSVSGLFAFLHARGDVAANPVPRGLPTRRERVVIAAFTLLIAWPGHVVALPYALAAAVGGGTPGIFVAE